MENEKRAVFAQVTVLFIGSIWPEPRSSAGGIRTENLLDACASAGFRCVFASPALPNPAMRELEEKGIEVMPVKVNDPAFDEWVSALAPLLVIYDRFFTEEQFGWRVRASCPDAGTVLDAIDLHFLRGAREEAKSIDVRPRGDAVSRELASIFRSDLTLLVSDAEEDLLVGGYDVPRRLLRTIRFAPAGEPGMRGSFEERRGFAMIGNFRHAPNRDSLDWVRAEIWPEIRRRLPDAELRVYGAYPTKEWMARDDAKSGFRVMGPADDAREALARARVNLAPLRFGAGIKGKILDGWWTGTPCVTTSVGAEGMSGGLRWGGEVRDGGAADLADAAVRMHESPELWARSARLSLGIARELYAPDKIRESIVAEARALLDELGARRAANPLREVFWHQSLRATEYFSRWIQLKSGVRA